MKKRSRKSIAKALSVAMTAALFASGITAPQSQAAAARVKKLSVSAAGKLYVGAYSPYTKTKLKVKVTPARANQKVTYKSNNKKIATVTKKGVVKAKKKGKVKITVTTRAKNARGKKLKKTIKLNIKKYKAPTGINASISATNLNIGDTATITASLTGNPTKKTLVYTTSAAGVASVNKKGVVTAKAAGTATITVKSSVKGNKGKVLSKSFDVTVNGGGVSDTPGTNSTATPPAAVNPTPEPTSEPTPTPTPTPTPKPTEKPTPTPLPPLSASASADPVALPALETTDGKTAATSLTDFSLSKANTTDMTNSADGMTIVSTLTINELNKNTNTYLWNFSNNDTWPVAYQYINAAGQLCTNIDLRAEFVTPENFLPIGEEFTLQTVLTKTEIRLYLNGELKAYYNATADFVLGGSFNILNSALVTSGQTSYGDAVRNNWKQLQLGVAPKCVTSQTAMKGTFSRFDIYKEPLMPVSGGTQASMILQDASYSISPENNTANFGAVLLNAAEGTTITYTSLDEDIAKFTEDGKLFLLKEGQARLKARASTGEEKTCTVTASYSTIGIHDPSVFQDPASGYYYTVGSHCLMGYSKDMKSWAYAANSQTGYSASNKLFTKVYTQEFKDVYAFVKPGVASPEGVWAPALYYSKEAGKYFMYVTIADGTAQGKCAIVLTSSDKPDGPYKYEEMLVASAMTTSDVDKTNLMDELDIADKTKVPAKYTSADRSYPDCIDATVFETHDGKLWMVYGSFTCSGGIRMIQLDKKTGGRLAGANYKDNGTASKLGMKDPYYGIQLAGSNGEGPFIMEVPSEKSSTGYYYFLWTSVGGLNAWGGYHMRMYRSENVEGPYVDTKGQEATASLGRSNLGLRVMDNYKFTFMDQAFTSCGGNSALTATDPTLKNEYGKMFLHYHQKWADPTGANGFVTKSNQMFLNEDGWLVTAPFDYDGETIGDGYSKEEVTGEYEFILHRTSYTNTSVPNYDYSDAVIINLNADGTVTGKYTGTWTLKDGKYITLKIGDDTYKGIVMKQTVENSSRNEAMVFTAVGDGNLQSVWGMKTFENAAYYAELDKEYVKMPADGTISKFTLPTKSEKYGFDISWTSGNTSVVSIDGGTATVNPGDAETEVTLTGTFTKGDFSKEYTWNVVIGAFAIPLNTVVDEDTITLPASFNDSPITWASENDNIINASTGAVTRSNDDQTVKLTATVNGRQLEYNMVVKSKVAIYTQDYTGVAATDALTSTNLQDGVSIKTDGTHDSYLAFTHPGGKTNSRGGVTDFGIASTPDRYVISMDTILTAGNNQATEFSISGSNFAYNTNINYTGATGCLLKLYSEKSEQWTINNNPEHKVTIPKDTWVSLKLYVDKTNETTWLKVTDSENKVLYDANVDYIGNGEIKGLHLLLGRYLAVMCVDNIKVY